MIQFHGPPSRRVGTVGSRVVASICRAVSRRSSSRSSRARARRVIPAVPDSRYDRERCPVERGHFDLARFACRCLPGQSEFPWPRNWLTQHQADKAPLGAAEGDRATVVLIRKGLRYGAGRRRPLRERHRFSVSSGALPGRGDRRPDPAASAGSAARSQPSQRPPETLPPVRVRQVPSHAPHSVCYGAAADSVSSGKYRRPPQNGQGLRERL